MIRRIALGLLALALMLLGAAASWRPGTSVRDGSHDLRRNGLWLAHGWLGGQTWFSRHHKEGELDRYRSTGALELLRARIDRGHITDVFPHLCPAEPEGRLPDVDPLQLERVLDVLAGTRVFPWIGGPKDDFPLHDAAWVERTARRSGRSDDVRHLDPRREAVRRADGAVDARDPRVE